MLGPNDIPSYRERTESIRAETRKALFDARVPNDVIGLMLDYVSGPCADDLEKLLHSANTGNYGPSGYVLSASNARFYFGEEAGISLTELSSADLLALDNINEIAECLYDDTETGIRLRLSDGIRALTYDMKKAVVAIADMDHDSAAEWVDAMYQFVCAGRELIEIYGEQPESDDDVTDAPPES